MRNPSAVSAALAIPLAALLAALLAVPAPAQSPAPPVLKVTRAEYRLDQNLLEFSFTVTNPSDSVVYVDCDGQPAAARAGKALSLAFAAPDAAAADSVRPQRVGARQGYQGHRRIHGLGPDTLGGAARSADPAAAAQLKVRMAYYPERLEGEGPAWMLERAGKLDARPVPLAKRGKRPAAQKPVKVVKPPED